MVPVWSAGEKGSLQVARKLYTTHPMTCLNSATLKGTLKPLSSRMRRVVPFRSAMARVMPCANFFGSGTACPLRVFFIPVACPACLLAKIQPYGQRRTVATYIRGREGRERSCPFQCGPSRPESRRPIQSSPGARGSLRRRVRVSARIKGREREQSAPSCTSVPFG